MQSMLARLDLQLARDLVSSCIDPVSNELQLHINKPIRDKQETHDEEFSAHDTICSYLERKGFPVARKAYDLDTSFETSTGKCGRQVVFCADYDALPRIDHACGYNLIGTASIAAFLGTAHILRTLEIPGQLRLLGTPATEAGRGKARLIDVGAFDPPEDIAAAIIAHHIISTPVRIPTCANLKLNETLTRIYAENIAASD